MSVWMQGEWLFGNLISGQGVSTNLEKLQAMMEWPIPKSLKALRRFLGLTGYYRRFIKKYENITSGFNYFT